MARFMIAHLQNGRLGTAHILREETAQEMHRRQFTHHPRLFGFAYGFYENDGFFESFPPRPRVLQHDGGWAGAAAKVVLLPDENAGFFEAHNTAEGKLHEELTRRLLEEYFPFVAQPDAARERPRARARRFAGSYRHNRYAHRTLEKIVALGNDYRVTADDDGIVTVHYPRDELPPTRWVEVEPLVIRQLDRETYGAFREDAAGRITHLFLGVNALERLHWSDTAAVQMPLVGCSLLVFVSALVGWPTVRLVRRLRGRAARGIAAPPAAGRIAALVSFACVALVASSTVLFILGMQLRVRNIFHGMSPWGLANLTLANLIAVLSVALSAYAVLAWRRRWWSRAARLHYTLVALAAAYFVMFLGYWNQLGWRY
jgi:hypothetical protein